MAEVEVEERVTPFRRAIAPEALVADFHMREVEVEEAAGEVISCDKIRVYSIKSFLTTFANPSTMLPAQQSVSIASHVTYPRWPWRQRWR